MDVLDIPLNIGTPILDDLASRLENLRSPTAPVRSAWSDGVDRELVTGLVNRLLNGLAWRTREAFRNRFQASRGSRCTR